MADNTDDSIIVFSRVTCPSICWDTITSQRQPHERCSTITDVKPILTHNGEEKSVDKRSNSGIYDVTGVYEGSTNKPVVPLPFMRPT